MKSKQIVLLQMQSDYTLLHKMLKKSGPNLFHAYFFHFNQIDQNVLPAFTFPIAQISQPAYA